MIMVLFSFFFFPPVYWVVLFGFGAYLFVYGRVLLFFFFFLSDLFIQNSPGIFFGSCFCIPHDLFFF